MLRRMREPRLTTAGAKAQFLAGSNGTAEAVPFHKTAPAFHNTEEATAESVGDGSPCVVGFDRRG